MSQQTVNRVMGYIREHETKMRLLAQTIKDRDEAEKNFKAAEEDLRKAQANMARCKERFDSDISHEKRLREEIDLERATMVMYLETL